MYGRALVAADGMTWIVSCEGGYGTVDVHPAARDLLAEEWELGVSPSELAWRDHDHSAEDAVLHAFENPTPENQHAAELAVAPLQRRDDHVLRRLDGTGALPPYPSHPHNAAEHPVDCLAAVLHELAGLPPAVLADRAETLAHGLAALRALEQQMEEARRWARGYEHGMFGNVDTDEPPEWLTAPLEAGGE